MENEEEPDEADAVLHDQGLHLPVEVAEGVLKEAGNVLEGPPLLCHIAWLSGCADELCEVTVSLLS